MDRKKKAEWISWVSFLLLTISGVLLHFAFEFSGGNTLVGAFTPVNESIWEHLKLILFPSLILGVIEYFFYGSEYPSFIGAKIISIFVGMLFIVLGYYTYTGIFGVDLAIINIVLFVLAAAITTYLTYRLSTSSVTHISESKTLALLLAMTAVIILFIYFTFHPPMLELFRDPVTEDFGITALLPYC